MLLLGRSSTSLKSSLISFSIRGMAAEEDGLETALTVSHCLQKHKTRERKTFPLLQLLELQRLRKGGGYTVQDRKYALLYDKTFQNTNLFQFRQESKVMHHKERIK